MNENLKEKAKQLPQTPGVYQFFDKEGNIIYIGKAKNLRKRVLSYFTKKHDSPKVRILVRKIHDIKFFTVNTETDAFLLENTLIKQYKPKYNIQLKDDKSYPWIVIKNEPYPRVFMTRNLIKDGSEYYGPFTSVDTVKTLLQIFKKVYHVRTCKLNLTEENIKKGKFKVCLDYHIGNCKAPCVGLQTKEEYDENIAQIRKILKGKISPAINLLKEQMFKYAENLEFEKADELKRKIQLLENYQSKSTVVNPNLKDIDVFGYDEDEKFAYVSFIKVVDGKIIRAYSTEIKKQLDETKEDILAHTVLHIRNDILKGVSNAEEIIVPFSVNLDLDKIKITVPQKGDKKQLLDLAQKNLKFYISQKRKERLNVDPHKNTIKVLENLKENLNLKNTPIHLECFDNSNLFGTNPVSACVVFKYGKPVKSEYRKFNVKTVEGIDDFATMYEVVYRRYKRVLDEGKELPDLIVIDGGKGQLAYAFKALQDLGIDKQVDIIAIAKRLDEIFKPGEKHPYYLDKTSAAIKIIQHARDEAHRFGITFHRQKRNKQLIHSELTEIEGIGEKTAKKLIAEFKGIENVKKASLEELEKVIGKSKALKVYEFFRKK